MTKKIRIQSPTIEFLESTFGNDYGDIVKIQMIDELGNVYYDDGFGRWCYLRKNEEGKIWKWKKSPSEMKDSA